MNILSENNRLSLVYMPAHLNEALNLLSKNPDALVYAGGTDILSHQTTRIPVFNRQIISLRRVEELQIMRRYENFVEIGAAVTLGDILRRKESRFLPPVLKYTVQAIGSPALRNIATAGGNLAVSDRKLLLLPVLLILDSFIEVRSQQSTRCLEIKRFLDETNTIRLKPGEIITKIRVPTGRFNLYGFSTLPGSIIRTQDYFMMCYAARKNRSVLEKINFAFNIDGRHIIRIKQTEDRLIGKKIPLLPSEIQEEMKFFQGKIESMLPFLSVYKKERIINYFRLMLTQEMNRAAFAE